MFDFTTRTALQLSIAPETEWLSYTFSRGPTVEGDGHCWIIEDEARKGTVLCRFIRYPNNWVRTSAENYFRFIPSNPAGSNNASVLRLREGSQFYELDRELSDIAQSKPHETPFASKVVEVGSNPPSEKSADFVFCASDSIPGLKILEGDEANDVCVGRLVLDLKRHDVSMWPFKLTVAPHLNEATVKNIAIQKLLSSPNSPDTTHETPSPIQMLAVELLVEIMKACLLTATFTRQERLDFMALRCVCSLWRKVAFSTPVLWTGLHITLGTQKAKELVFDPNSLPKSPGSIEPVGMPPIIKLVSVEGRKWKCIELPADPSITVPFIDFVKMLQNVFHSSRHAVGPWMYLRRTHLTLVDVATHKWPFTNRHQETFQSIAPNLQRLRLYWDCSYLAPFSHSTLTELDSRFCDYCLVGPLAAIKMISGFPRLVCLSLDDSTFAGSTPNGVWQEIGVHVHFNNLTDLSLGFCMKILRCGYYILAPKLCRLKLRQNRSTFSFLDKSQVDSRAVDLILPLLGRIEDPNAEIVFSDPTTGKPQHLAALFQGTAMAASITLRGVAFMKIALEWDSDGKQKARLPDGLREITISHARACAKHLRLMIRYFERCLEDHTVTHDRHNSNEHSDRGEDGTETKWQVDEGAPSLQHDNGVRLIIRFVNAPNLSTALLGAQKELRRLGIKCSN
ncbi:hypothetical protein FA15DRAFT_754686 [Coprinopsis marcescibilis]|uniref:F-box domain-containing protein n=1 Tax=Coprinopsis marcescibilis TaxID=230819 RepID=A0A5C3L1J7_COPMA|nr:hypothetical protein FA15DRAFT_754686 [Coprinopsis marcescibilis]